MSDLRLTRIAITLASCTLTACSNGTSSGANEANGGSTNGGAAGDGAIANGGTVSSGGDGGSGGATAGNGGIGGEAGTNAVGGGTANGGSAGTQASGGDAGVDGGDGSCPPSALFCDDFEKYPDGATDLSPDWIAYSLSGSVKVDSTNPLHGGKSLHLTTEAGMRHYADIIRQTKGVELLPLNHYGRFMVWISAIPSGAQHWNLNISSGPMAGSPDEVVKFAEGGMFGKLMSNYAQRIAPKNGDDFLLRGGGPEQGDPGADADCAVAAPSQTIEAGKWVCWQWQFDGTTDSAHLWIHDAPMTDVDAVGHGTQCQGPGFMGRTMSAQYQWEAPAFFDQLTIGWEQYQDNPAEEVWIDDVVVSAEPVSCPPPVGDR